METLVDNKTEERLKYLSWCSNRRLEQLRYLFELCNCDFDKLLKLEGTLKRYMCLATPGSKESVEKVLLVKNYDEAMEAMGYKKSLKTDFYVKLPTLANVKKDERYDVYIGRANAWLNLPHSKWHNPFVLKRKSEREECLKEHREYFLKEKELIEALPELEGKVLGCYCYSSITKEGKKCHGHNLVEFFEEFVLGYKKD